MMFSSKALAVAAAASACALPFSQDDFFATAFVILPTKSSSPTPSLLMVEKIEFAHQPTLDTETSSWLSTFRMLDADNSGTIDREELKSGLIALGQPSSDDDILSLLEREEICIDLNGDVSINKETFLHIVGAHDADKELSHSDLIEMFQAIDLDASGYFTAAELQHFLGNLPNVSFLGDSKMSQLLGMYDDDGNGRITFDEFVDIVKDLGFTVSKDASMYMTKIEEGEEDDATLQYFEPGAGAADVSFVKEVLDIKKGNDIEKSESKLLSLSSIENEDLREALASFDADGSGTIDLHKVRQAAEGKLPPKLHWSENRLQAGLSDYVQSVNHIAILVSDISKSLDFYKNAMGFEQIRRPNFDAHGAWLTMGNCELHLIKGKPIVHSSDDLVCPHISLNADNINGVLPKLQSLGVPFRINSSVPAGADAGTTNTNDNDDMMSDSIITQFFIQDPDGYYLEVCNCDETLTKYCLGEKDELAGYEEGTKPLSLSNASTTLNLMQRWMAKVETETANMEELTKRLKKTDGSIKQVAALLGCEPAIDVDETIMATIKDRHSVYGDVWQNEEESDIEEVLREAGNDPKVGEKIVKLRQKFRGKTIYRPPVVFNPDGTKYTPQPIECDIDDDACKVMIEDSFK